MIPDAQFSQVVKKYEVAIRGFEELVRMQNEAIRLLREVAKEHRALAVLKQEADA